MQSCGSISDNPQWNASEVPQGIKEDIDRIREWQRKQPHLDFKIDDQLILSFLRCSKFSIERTKEKIDNYYTMRTHLPEILWARDPFSEEIQAVLNAGVILPLPKPDEDGCKIILCHYGSNLNPNTIHCTTIIKVFCMVLDILLREDSNVLDNGLKPWTECKGCPLQYAKQVTPGFLKKATCATEIAFPFRIKGIYTTNCAPILEFVYNFVKVLFSKKITKRTFLYSENNFDQFYTKIPQRFLPEEFGGDNGSVKELTGIWKKKIESCRDLFIEEEKFKSDERLRENQTTSHSNLFGIEGSFRKLDID